MGRLLVPLAGLYVVTALLVSHAVGDYVETSGPPEFTGQPATTANDTADTPPAATTTPPVGSSDTLSTKLQTSRGGTGQVNTAVSTTGYQPSTETAASDSFPLSDLELGLSISCFLLLVVCVIGTVVLCRLRRSMRRMTHTLYPVPPDSDHVYQDVAPVSAGRRGNKNNKVELLTIHHCGGDGGGDEQLDSPGITNLPPIPPSSIKKSATAPSGNQSHVPPLPSTIPGAKMKQPAGKLDTKKKVGVDNIMFESENILRSASETSFGGTAKQNMEKSRVPANSSALSDVEDDDTSIYEEYEQGKGDNNSMNEYTVDMIDACMDEVITPNSNLQTSINFTEQVTHTHIQDKNQSMNTEARKQSLGEIDRHMDNIPFYLDLQEPEGAYDTVCEDLSTSALGNELLCERQTSLSGLPGVDIRSQDRGVVDSGIGGPLEEMDNGFYENVEKDDIQSGLPDMSSATVDLGYNGESYDDVEFHADTRRRHSGSRTNSSDSSEKLNNLSLYGDPELDIGEHNANSHKTPSDRLGSKPTLLASADQSISIDTDTEIEDGMGLYEDFMNSFDKIRSESLTDLRDQHVTNDDLSETDYNHGNAHHSDGSPGIAIGAGANERIKSENTIFDTLTSPDSLDKQAHVMDRAHSGSKTSNFDTVSVDSYFLDMDDHAGEIEESPLVQRKISSNIYFSGTVKNIHGAQTVEPGDKSNGNVLAIRDNILIEQTNTISPLTKENETTDNDSRTSDMLFRSNKDGSTHSDYMNEKAKKIFIPENNSSGQRNLNEFQENSMIYDFPPMLHGMSADEDYSPPIPSSPPPPLPSTLPPGLPRPPSF